MVEKIGGVTLNYQYYEGRDLYSDGPIEDQMLEICKAGRQQDALRANTEWPILYHFSPVRQGILDWYPMEKDASVLEIGAGCGAITGVLSRKVKRVVCIELSKKRSMINAYQNQDCGNVEIYVGKYEDIKLEEKFDYVTLIGVLEYASYYTNADNPYMAMLEQIKAMLKPGGKLLIAIENRMGLKYLNGASEDHTGRLFDGIHNYADKGGAKTFTKGELSKLFSQAGLTKYKFFYPLPDYKLPYAILSDEYEPNVGAFQNYDVAFDGVRYEFFDESVVWDTLYADHMGGYFANSLFVEVGCSEKFSNIIYARYSWDRDKKYMTKTFLVNDQGQKHVLKLNLMPEGQEYLEAFFEKYDLISDIYEDMTVVSPERLPEGVRFPYIEGRSVHNILLEHRFSPKKLSEEIGCYLNRMLSFKDEYIADFYMTEEFRNIFGDIPLEGVPAVKVANIDCLFENVIESGDELYCFDYEWTFHFPMPIFYLKFRILARWYNAVEKYLPFDDIVAFLQKYGLTIEEISVSQRMEDCFLQGIYNGTGSYMQQYAKQTIFFDDYERAFTVLSEEKEATKKEQEELLAENTRLNDKLLRHLANEERLRKVIKQLKGE